VRFRWLVCCAILLAAAPARAADSDGDGLSDDDEQNGVAGEPLLDLPAMGADPAAPDLFVQVDYETCDPVLSYCGPENTFDTNRLGSRAAFRLAAFFAPDIRLHLDTGVPTLASDAAFVHGDWGGTHRLPTGPHPCNPDLLGARFGYFHRTVVAGTSGGGGGDLYGFCSGGDTVHMGVLAQELGHNFGIGHGGNFDSYPANCKPHYRSPMNYAYTYDDQIVQYSRGQFAGVVLDPARMDELAGLGTTDPTVLQSLRDSPWLFNVREDGAIDWNRDGRFEAGTVRAAPTWAYASCEQSSPHTDALAVTSEPALAWLGDAGGGTPRLYLISRSQADGTLEARFLTRFDACDPFVEPQSCTDWDPKASDPARAVPGSKPGRGWPAVASTTTVGARLVVVYADAVGLPWSQTLSMSSGAEAWSAPAMVDATPLTGDPALVEMPGGQALLLMAPIAGGMAAWQLDLTSGTWSGPTAQMWDDGSAMQPCWGAALARGWLAGQPDEQLVTVVPEGASCELIVATRDAATGLWTRLGDGIWTGLPPVTGARPSLQYVPYDNATPEDGRFYLAWRPNPTGAALIAMTEGNDARAGAVDRRFVFIRGTFMRNVWALLGGAPDLEYDARFDENLRAVQVYEKSGGLWFMPFADGVTDVEMRDQDDYHFIKQFLACSLDGSCKP
jgi:hypothetical protein